jgi:hypothetical protein
MMLIKTKYLGPTSTTGSKRSKISVTAYSIKHRIIEPYNHSMDSFENHRSAANKFAKMMKLEGEYAVASSKNGYTFVRIGETEHLGG